MTAFARAVAFSGILLALVIAGTGMIDARGESGVESHPMIGMAAPGFDLQGIGGDKLSLADLRGKFVVIHFGASW